MLPILFTLTLGVLAVLQGAINRIVAREWGLTSAIILNGLVIMGVSLMFYACVKFQPRLFPDFFRDKTELSRLSWYFFLPGLCGFVIVAGIPYAIDKIGALNVFIVIVCAQMAASLAWDNMIDGIPVSWPRLAGAVLAATGALVARIKS